MHKLGKISLVIPCYNEEKGIQVTLSTIPDSIDEIIVVDNNSTDNTAQVASEMGARVITERKQGYGAAYKAGFAAATGDVIVTMDGDGTYPRIAINYLLDVLYDDKLDFISAARLPIDFSKSKENLLRYFGNIGLTILVWMLFFVRLRDSQSGMWIFRRKILDLIEVKSEGMPFSEEFKIKAFRHPNIAAREVPIQFKYIERIGKSKLSLWKDGWINITYLFKMRFRREMLE